jgi:uncharacterized protein
MGRHGTREDAVDALLRGGRLVDLYRAVRQGVRASVESYSIKKLEPLYGFDRSVELRDAGSSIVEFEEWLQLGDGDRPASDILQRIEEYNRDDVVSTQRLRDWLEERRGALAGATGFPVARPGPRDAAPTEALGEELARIAELAGALSAGVSADAHRRTMDEQARWLLSELLSWHRREDKSFWWLHFHLRDELTDDERIDASEPIGGLAYQGVVDEIAKSLVHRYRFPPQDHDIRVGGNVKDPATDGSPGTVVAIDNAACSIDLKRARNSPVPHPTSIIPHDYFNPKEHVGALVRLAEWVRDHGIDDPASERRAARDLLRRHPPRLAFGDAGLAALPAEDDLHRARRLATQLDATTFAIQGPPGSGKTFTGARMALDLVRAGKRVGVTANSHKVIGNFLRALVEAAHEDGEVIRIGQRSDPEDVFDDPMLMPVQTADGKAMLASGELQVLGATSFVWTRADYAGTVDVLFVDEAGQMSLANAVAVSQAGTNLVLLGDPQQLEQPLKGTHPPGAERSALAHLLGEAPTIPDDLGLFLETTWRLHPAICDFTSLAFYDDRLTTEPHLARQEVLSSSPLSGTGLRLLDVRHAGDDSISEAEAAAVADLARQIVDAGTSWVDQRGQLQVLTWEDILIVAPYNAQVGAIQRLVPTGARVGTVDKFQGQEAPISIYSMTTSSAEEAPRGMGFLYSRHRLNVATSRARCLAVVVASPELVRVRARTVEQMRLANALCLFVDMAHNVRSLPG